MRNLHLALVRTRVVETVSGPALGWRLALATMKDFLATQNMENIIKL